MLRKRGFSGKFKENNIANVAFSNVLKMNPCTLGIVLLF